MPPLKATDFLVTTDPGKQLVDPSQFYQAMQMLLGFANVMAVPNAQAPGPLLTAAVNTLSSPPGAGPFNVRLPVALGGLRLVIVNLATGPVTLNPSYNPALGRVDQLVGTSPPPGNVYSAIAYNPGFWYVASVASGLPPADEPPVIDEPPTEEC